MIPISLFESQTLPCIFILCFLQLLEKDFEDGARLSVEWDGHDTIGVSLSQDFDLANIGGLCSVELEETEEETEDGEMEESMSVSIDDIKVIDSRVKTVIGLCHVEI